MVDRKPSCGVEKSSDNFWLQGFRQTESSSTVIFVVTEPEMVDKPLDAGIESLDGVDGIVKKAGGTAAVARPAFGEVVVALWLEDRPATVKASLPVPVSRPFHGRLL
jgi:hypothetical protein